MSRTIPQNPFERRTGFQREIDATIAALVEIRQRQSVANGFDEDNADSLRCLAGAVKDTARVVDPLFHRLAYEAGLGSLSNASKWASLVTDYALEDLLGEIEARAMKIEDERGGESQETRDRREHSTLNHRQQGI